VMKHLIKGLNKINLDLFTPANPKSIILFRVCLAIMLAYMFAPRGLSPIFPLTKFPDLHQYLFSDAYYVLIYILITLFALGIKSQIIALLLFIVLLPHDFLSSGRTSKQVILCVLLCYVFIKSLPVWKFNNTTYKKSDLCPIWPIRLIQIQLSILYGVNAISKTSYHYLSGQTLIDMSTTYKNYQVDLSDGFLHLYSLAIPVYLLAIVSVLIEYFLAIGFWFKKTKWIAVTVGLIFHGSLVFVMTIFMLDYVSVFLYITFIIPFKLKTQTRS